MFKKHRSAAGVLANKQEAECAVRDLLRAGHDLNHVSVAAMEGDVEGNVVGTFETGHASAPPGRSNQLWGGVWGMVSESAFFEVPALGPVMAGGPLVAFIISRQKAQSPAAGLSVVGDAFLRMGVPMTHALHYEAALRARKYILMVHGTALEVGRAKRVLRPRTIAAPSVSHDVVPTVRRASPWEVTPAALSALRMDTALVPNHRLQGTKVQDVPPADHGQVRSQPSTHPRVVRPALEKPMRSMSGVLILLLAMMAARPVHAGVVVQPEAQAGAARVVYDDNRVAVESPDKGPLDLVAAVGLARVPLQQSRHDEYLLTGKNAWLVAGVTGALIPVLLFAIPVLSFALFGPFAPVAFLLALVVATVTTGFGGAVAWIVSAMFSNVRSGFLLPVVASALVGFGATFIGGVLATCVIAFGFTLAWLATPAGPRFTGDPYTWRNYMTPGNAPILLGFGLLAMGFWAAGVVTASVGGPMTAAYLYQENGTLK